MTVHIVMNDSIEINVTEWSTLLKFLNFLSGALSVITAAFLRAAHHRYINERAIRRERVFRERCNPLAEFDDGELYSRYRFDRNGVLFITDLIMRRHCISDRTKLCHSSRNKGFNRTAILRLWDFSTNSRGHNKNFAVFGIKDCKCSFNKSVKKAWWFCEVANG